MSRHELRPLVLDELEPVIELHRHTWSPDVPAEVFRRVYMQLLRTPWARGHVQILGWYEGGVLISAFRLYRLEMLMNGHKRSCAGMGTVLTFPERRNRGHASAMLRTALDAFAPKYETCILFSASGPRFYRELGFFPLPNLKYVLIRPTAESASGGKPARKRAAVPVEERLEAEARLYGPQDLPDLVSVYNLDVSLRKLGILRSESYWQHLFERERVGQMLSTYHAPGKDGEAEAELRTFMCMVEGQPKSYITVRLKKDRVQIMESPAESYQFQNWMLRYAISLSRSEEILRVESQVPLRSPDGEVRVLVRRDSPLMMLHPLGSGLRPEDFPYPAENFLWSRDRF